MEGHVTGSISFGDELNSIEETVISFTSRTVHDSVLKRDPDRICKILVMGDG